MPIGWSIKRIVEEGKADVSPTDLITDLWDLLNEVEKLATGKVRTSARDDRDVWWSIRNGISKFKGETIVMVRAIKGGRGKGYTASEISELQQTIKSKIEDFNRDVKEWKEADWKQWRKSPYYQRLSDDPYVAPSFSEDEALRSRYESIEKAERLFAERRYAEAEAVFELQKEREKDELLKKAKKLRSLLGG